MPRVVFVQPCIGRVAGRPYVRSWQMQPLAIATLAALTPPSWERVFYDDRLEPVDTAASADLAAITVETYTARRAYQLAEAFRRRGTPVVLGGYHVTLCPDEARKHADAICIGEAEGVWGGILSDAAARRLQPVYAARNAALAGVRPDRSIFAGKDYFKLALVETSRGCRFACSFCSITAFHEARHRRRPVAEIIAELKALRERLIFFVDDNITAERASARELFEALVPLRLGWISQISLDAARDPELIRLMARSGCRGVLIGFESLHAEGLACLHKQVNRPSDYAGALRNLREAGIVVYGAFILGLPGDNRARANEAVAFAREHRMFLAAFAHLTPFPGTPLYRELEEAGRLRWPQWWLSPDYRFGQAAFHPEAFTAGELEELCMEARRGFFSWSSIVARGLDFKANGRTPRRLAAYWSINALMNRELSRKFVLPLGVED